MQKPKTKSEQHFPKLIGITGGIGSGKTAVAKIIENSGYPVYYSDDRAKDIVNDNAKLKTEISKLLGENAYDEKGNYNRKWVAQQIFNDDEKRLALNALIHPAVRLDFENWRYNQTSNWIFKETALLFELGLDKDCDTTILVTADEETRIRRVMMRDNKTREEVWKIIQKQMPEEEKRQKADFIIENHSDISQLEEQVRTLLNEHF